MAMEGFTMDSLNTAQLSQLLKLDDFRHWDQQDGTAALRHQLAAPLLLDLLSHGVVESRVQELAALMARQHQPSSQSLLDHLTSATPVFDVLDEIKGMARQVRDEPESPLHGGPATVLYFAAVAAALVGGAMRLSRLSDSELVSGFRWGERQPGAEALAGLFRRALLLLETPSRNPIGGG
jgi:hypothetical protein